MRPFYVINGCFNDNRTEKYDIMKPLLYLWHDKDVRRVNKIKNMKRDTVARFIESEGKYHYWSRCEYEIIISSWPQGRFEEKWDIWQQIEMNFDTIVDIFIQNLKEEKKAK